MNHTWLNHIEQTLIVSNDDGRCLVGMHLVHTVSHDTHCIHVETRVGFIEDRELWLEHSHLENLVALLLTTRETFVYRTASQLAVQFHQLALLAHQLHEFACVQWFQTLILALGIDSRTHEVGHGYARNLHRILEREEQAFTGTVLWLHIQEVLAVEDSLTLGYGIERVTCEHSAQG